MKSIIAKSFETMVFTYKNLLNDFYPARGSTGFTESNQVHIYVNSLISSLDDPLSVSWLEFPWEDKKQHIDAFIYSPKYKSVFYVEAKRLSISKKKNEIQKDILRIINADRSFIKENNIVNINSEYVIALSDVWLETKWKKSMPEWWCGFGKVPKQALRWEVKQIDNFIKPKATLEDELVDIDWKSAEKYVYWLGEDSKKLFNYCLLMASKKI